MMSCTANDKARSGGKREVKTMPWRFQHDY